MNLIHRIKSLVGIEQRAAIGVDGWPMPTSYSTVTPDSAQALSGVYSCVAAISETVASLPLILFRKDGQDRERASDHPLYRVLHDQFNPEMTAIEGREMMQAAVLLRGNAYARIVRRWDGQCAELWPLNPDGMQVRRAPSGELVYDYSHDGKLQRYLAHEILHIRHRIGPDGILGMSPVSVARSVLELAQAETQHGQATFANGGRLQGVLRVAGQLKPEQRQAIAASWATQHSGGMNSGKTAILESGTEFQPLAMTLQDASWVESRRFSLEEICRLFRVPPTMVGDLTHGNFSNSSEMARQFVTLCLRRHLLAWEQAISAKCLTEAGRRTYFAQHQVEGLLRGDSVARSAFYSAGIAAGYLLPSEARALEDLPTVPGIDDAPRNITSTVPAQPYPSRQ